MTANLSPELVGRLADLFPDSAHVFHTGLARLTSDEMIWEYARANRFVLVTADSDLLDLAAMRGAPKVIRLENCNYRTAEAEALLRRHAILIAELEYSDRAVLVIRHRACQPQAFRLGFQTCITPIQSIGDRRPHQRQPGGCSAIS